MNHTVLALDIAHYSHTGDIIVFALCMIMAVLLLQSNIKKNKNFRIIIVNIVSIFLSSLSNLLFQLSLESTPVIPGIAYGLRIFHHLLLAFSLFLYVEYLNEPLWISENIQKKYATVASAAAASATVFDIVASIAGFGFVVDENGIAKNGFNIYFPLLIAFYISIFYIIIKYRSRIIKQVYIGLLGVNTIALLLLGIQSLSGNASFTTIAYCLPMVGIVFMFHSNPYDINTGAVSGSFFQAELENSLEKKQDIILLSCKILDFDKIIKHSKDFKLEFYKFLHMNVRRGILYNFSNYRLVLSLVKPQKGDSDKLISRMIDDFSQCYGRFKIDYKIVICDTKPGVIGPHDYIKLIEFTEKTMPHNTLHHITDDDISRFYNSSYILSQLEDIALKKDPFDPRVIVYCQPVFNISTGKYDTAEALMRLKLDNIGMVFPDQFIPLAEQNNIIHTLSMIILNKTCFAVKKFMDEGYNVHRISVNFSTLDIRYDSFCSDVQNIIDSSGISYDKIAVEITESRSDADFNIMKQRVIQLQKLGIKFYLDDFGTGYSNFERIMELPFDIIKFDRSMLIESVKNDTSRFMVSTFANMFNTLNYSVLFEGVENDHDEQYCVSMKAKYLQGYKYSRPIPIEQLTDFLNLTDAV